MQLLRRLYLFVNSYKTLSVVVGAVS